MVDLFQAAGVVARNESGGKAERAPRPSTGGEKRKLRVDERDTTFGGHNLRKQIRSRDPYEDTLVSRPRTVLASSAAAQLFTDLTSDATTEKHENPPTGKYAAEESEDDDEYDEDRSDPYGDEEDYDDRPNDEAKRPARPSEPSIIPTPPSTLPHSTPLTAVTPHSRLTMLATDFYSSSGFNLARELGWQAAVAGDSQKCKSFRQEVTQQVDTTPFGFMRPSSPFIQILHSVATYAVRGGDSELHNMDYGFVGDRTDIRLPSAVIVDDKMWKWVSKTLGLDVPPLEEYYAKPVNANQLYHDDASGGEQTTVPRMIYLPPPFVLFCLEKNRTPFELHQFVASYATRPGAEVDIKKCTLIMDWCFFAAHRAAKSTPTTSMLAISLQTAPSDDDDFLRWLYKIDCTKEVHIATTSAPAPLPAPQAATAQAATARLVPSATAPQWLQSGPPPPDVWERMAKSISNSFATAAAALQPPPADPSDAEYERGGVDYDSYQLAILQGFSHAPDITGVPVIWAHFQYSKNIETHKDNLRRRMTAWATDTARTVQVPIERGLYIPDSTMKEILTLNFNPGGILAEADEADRGLSLLICRARTMAAKTAIRKYEKALEQSRRNRSMAEAHAELTTHTAYDAGALPDNYHELLRCIGTFCAMLHALFGDRCVFYRHCYALWMAMNSDLVYEQRGEFNALYCRQIVWAVLMESRVYFSQRMSVEEFENVHPDDIMFPKSSLLSVVQLVRDMSPISRSSFPAAWNPTGGRIVATPATVASASVHGGTVPPVPTVATTGGATPTVVSGMTTGSTRQQRPPIAIRATDIHPQLKAAMEAYIAKNKGVYLSTILSHVNLTLDDLPRLPTDVSGSNGICYNYILGRCAMGQCQHEHVHARDVTDEFASELLSKLRPGITEFTANGLPPGTRRRRRPRRNASA